MAGWTIQIDPPAVATDRTMLDLNNGPIQVGTDSSGGLGIDWGQAAITAYETQQGQWGNSVSDYVFPNRTVTINLILGGTGYEEYEETARTELSQKVALLQREGGQILRQREGGLAMYADIVNASLTLPDLYGETGEIEPDVVLTLELLPDFYGDSITLDTIHSTGLCNTVLTQSSEIAVIQGDYPARCQIQVTDASGNNQNGLFWGVRSRYYTSATTAALFYEAESLTPLNGATVATLSGASGGHVVEQTALPPNSWVPVLATTIASGSAAMTHQGSYQVWMRASGTAAPQLRLRWGNGSLANPEVNDPVTVPASGGMNLVSLGTIRLDSPPVGASNWTGAIDAMANALGQTIYLDAIYFQPLDEAAGQCSSIQASVPGSVNVAALPSNAISSTAVAGTAWSNPGNATAWDNSYASVSLTGGAVSEYLDVYGFGFDIPSGATITGIGVQYLGYSSSQGVAAVSSLKLVRAGTLEPTGITDGTPIGTSPGSKFYGGTGSDLWSASWTPSNINSSTFGAALQVIGYNGVTVYIDTIYIYVWYTLSSGLPMIQDVVMASDGPAEMTSDGMFRQDPAGSAYAPVSQVIGDFPRIPASGMEQRAAQLLIKPSRGDLNALPDAGLDAFTVTASYRPCWLSRP